MDKRVLLIIGGGISAYKSLFLIRLLAKRGIASRVILTRGGSEFVTPLSAGSLSGERVFSDLWDLTAESEMGHIELSRSADLVVVAPATADLMAKAAHGIANDLASTTLLAAIENLLRGNQSLDAPQPLKGRHALVTAGPTREPIDPVRYLSNHSSGKQGYAIASALRALGARVTLVSGPTNVPAPIGIKFTAVETARDMLAASEAALPADIFVAVAAVADWHVSGAANKKIKKGKDGLPELKLAENPDILATLSRAKDRPSFVVGFAAETDDVVTHAKAKLAKKQCDMIIANDVSGDVMGGDYNTMIIVTASGEEIWPRMSKPAAARKLALTIAAHFKGKS